MSDPAVSKAPISRARYCELLSSERVKIVVGPEAEVFDLPKGIATWASPTLAAAFDGDSEEAKTGTLILKDASANAFKHAVPEMFGAAKFTDDEKYEVVFADNMDVAFNDMIELASMGAILQMPRLDVKAAGVVQSCALMAGDAITVEHILHAYDVLPTKSKTRYQFAFYAFLDFRYSGWGYPYEADLHNWKFNLAVETFPEFAVDILIESKGHMAEMLQREQSQFLDAQGIQNYQG